MPAGRVGGQGGGSRPLPRVIGGTLATPKTVRSFTFPRQLGVSHLWERNPAHTV